jgi:Uma2 family endonuclease
MKTIPEYITEKEYLAFERSALDKHEYYKGKISIMNGASFAHNLISSNCIRILGSKIESSDYQLMGSQLRIHVPKNTLYTYADLIIFDKNIEATDEESDTATNPIVIIEIVSPTRNNKSDKFSLYRDINSLKEYILIQSERFFIEKYIKNKDNSWTLTEYKTLDESFFVTTVGIEMQLLAIYEGVKIV